MSTFRGLFPPIITTFAEDGRFDSGRMESHVDFMIGGGSDGLCVGSSTGEFTTLTRQEWEEVVDCVVRRVAGRVPVLASPSSLSTSEALDRARFAERAGCKGLLVVSPFYQVHTSRELYAHFAAIRDGVSIPIMIYNNPPVTGVNLGFDLLVRMTKDGIIQYIKDAAGDPYMLARLHLELGERLGIFYGHDMNILGSLAFGAVGWVSGTANFDPIRWSSLVHAVLDRNDFLEARRIWYEILPFIDLTVTGEGGERADWVAVIKRGLELRGREVGPVRRPMLPLTAATESKVQSVVAALSFQEAVPA